MVVGLKDWVAGKLTVISQHPEPDSSWVAGTCCPAAICTCSLPGVLELELGLGEQVYLRSREPGGGDILYLLSLLYRESYALKRDRHSDVLCACYQPVRNIWRNAEVAGAKAARTSSNLNRSKSKIVGSERAVEIPWSGERRDLRGGV